MTKREPSVTDVIAFDEYPKEEVLTLAASVEKGSEHPLAQAIIKGSAQVTEEKITSPTEVVGTEEQHQRLLQLESPNEFQAISGMGVRAEIQKKAILFGNRKLMEKFGVLC